MNILYVNTNFYEGGAAKVARQLYYGMKERGHKVYFLAGYSSKDDEECLILNSSSISRYYHMLTGVLQNNQVLSRRKARNQILSIVKEKKIDIVHFHNLFENYIGIKDIAYIAKRCKVVWTLHDMWAVTGHCAIPMKCEEWKKGCPNCKEKRFYPAFYYNDVDKKYKWKKKCFTEKGIVFVTPSHWLEQICRESYLKEEKIFVVANGIDTKKYMPLDKQELRKKYEIPEEKIVLFFTAAVVEDWRKGIYALVDALKGIEEKEKYLLLIAGNGNLEKQFAGYEIRHMGYVREEKKMNELYNLADIYINPSMQESFGFTSVEAAATETPVIAFHNTALAEIVTEDMGFSVESGNLGALRETIQNAVKDRKKLETVGKSARQKVLKLYSEERMLEQYEEIYRKLLK